MHNDVELPSYLNGFINRSYEFDTVHLRSFAGREFIKNKIDNELKSYSINCARLSNKEFLDFISFFKNCGGALISFNFYDQFDHKIERQNLSVGVAGNTNKKFKLCVKHRNGDLESQKNILKPKEDTIKLYLNGDFIESRFHVDTKEVEIMSPLPEGCILQFSCEFFTPVRFITTRVETKIALDGSIQLNEIMLREVTDA